MIYHILSQSDWEQAQRVGSYTAESLGKEGFIHFSLANQVAATAERYYRGRSDLVLLEVDEPRVKPEVRYELAHLGEKFPHVYGALNLDAVIRVLSFAPDDEGHFHFPAA
jgi:uncharacterized protein (DUF952 family)